MISANLREFYKWWAYQPDKEEEDGDDTGVPGTADEYRGEVESGDYAACPCRSYNRADRAGYVPLGDTAHGHRP